MATTTTEITHPDGTKVAVTTTQPAAAPAAPTGKLTVAYWAIKGLGGERAASGPPTQSLNRSSNARHATLLLLPPAPCRKTCPSERGGTTERQHWQRMPRAPTAESPLSLPLLGVPKAHRRSPLNPYVR